MSKQRVGIIHFLCCLPLLSICMLLLTCASHSDSIGKTAFTFSLLQAHQQNLQIILRQNWMMKLKIIFSYLYFHKLTVYSNLLSHPFRLQIYKYFFNFPPSIQSISWANLQRRLSEGWAKESRRAGAAEYVTKDKSQCGSHHSRVCDERWAKIIKIPLKISIIKRNPYLCPENLQKSGVLWNY